MSTKKNHSAESLRATADTASAKWREANEIAIAKRDAHGACPTRGPFGRTFSNDDLRSAQLNVEALEAEAFAERVRHAAVLALDAAEIAERDELASARDPKQLHTDLTELDAEVDALNLKINEVQRRRSDRVNGALSADVAHAARRVAGGQPASASLPRFPLIEFGTLKKTRAQLLAEHVEPCRDFTTRIADARKHELSIASELEEARLEREAEAKDRAGAKAWREQAIKDEQRAVHAKERAKDDEQTSEARRREKLGKDYLARQSGGSAQ